MSRKHTAQLSHETDWDVLLSQLPAHLQARFDRALRSALKRRLQQIKNLDASIAPDAVRSQAVSMWRKRYMKGKTKSVKRRMNYARLCDEATFVELERELLASYWATRPEGRLSSGADVDSMSFAEACEAYRAMYPERGGSPLNSFAAQAIRQIYDKSAPAKPVQESIASHLCNSACTKRFDKVSDSDALAFGLEDVTSEQEVLTRVRERRLIEYLVRIEYKKKPAYLVARDLIVQRVAADPQVVAIQTLIHELMGPNDNIANYLKKRAKPDARSIEKYLLGEKMAKRIAHELLQNPYYGAQFTRAVELRLRVRENVPRTPMEAYPLARTMTRHIVVHVGPTNSGKTHDALQVLAAAPSGAYLGPLRLLAYEQFEELNRMGCVCSLLTGEEAVELAGARHVSSTVEMANFYRGIDVAVIDEAQMIADRDRGHHWTAAILGIPAREVHVCCAPHAERMVYKLAALCDDHVEVVYHERLVPLQPSRGTFRLPADVRAGDALVVFSRKSVHAVASQVAAAGHSPSVIYGALPHDVRHEEARRFDEGETDVVVATDAIGMGMNLPIRRVVFVEQAKFDGRDVRMLLPEEVQQIAGRAGRFGRYDVGYYTSTHQRREMVRRYERSVPSIESIPVGIPEDIALVRDATLTDCIRQWMAMEQPRPFERIGIERDLALIGDVEARLSPLRRVSTDDKLLVLKLATMAFDERNRELYRTWRRMVKAELAGEELELVVPPEPVAGTKLIELEQQYRYCDLLYTYARTFKHPQNVEQLFERRAQISGAMIRILADAS